MAAPPAFRPDSALAAAVKPSPNHGERLGAGGPDGIVLHYPGMRDGPSALAWLRAPASQVSCHYVVEEDGGIVQLVPEARRAWHAGRSSWAGDTDLNSATVGIEVVNGGHDFGLPPYPDRQVAAVAALCRDVAGRHGIAPHRVLAHSDIAPGRKRDPGELFPWGVLAEAGVGLWVPPSDDPAEADDVGRAGLAAFQAGRARYGYGLAAEGRDDAAARIGGAACQRRGRPARVDGRADPGTRDTLARLLALRFGPGA